MNAGEITLEAVLEGRVRFEDLSIDAGALERQARVAEMLGRRQLAENLRRAAELTQVPDSRVLEIYGALRPGRADREKLLALAGDLEREYGARLCAALIREAAAAL